MLERGKNNALLPKTETGEGMIAGYSYSHSNVLPKGVVILGLLIESGVSIFETFPRTGYDISNV